MAGRGRGRSEDRNAGLALLFLVLAPAVVRAFDYNEAMSKTLLFFEAQRSGPLSAGSDRVPWRGSSGLSDGSLAGVDLTGGYYDAGDNVKFGFAMAFSMTLLSWSVVEYGDAMSSAGELQNALNAVRWGTDWFLKAYQGPTTLYAQVGDGNSDHACWERPETMDTPRTVYKIDQNKPGSDYAGEAAAALAAASIAFKNSDPSYSATLLDNAKQLFQFADQYRAKYSDSIPEVQNFYNSFSGYNDELLWAAAWLHRATGDATYLKYVDTNAQSLNGLGSISEFSWDNKLAGAQILIARQVLHCGADSSQNLKQMRQMAEQYVCAYVNGGVTSTPDGLAWVRQWAPLQYSNNAAFAAAVYSDYLAEAGQSLTCGGKTFTPDQIMTWSKSQVDYVLGKNNAGRSLMVGFGNNYPTRMHHRGASLPVTETPYSCGEGYAQFYNTQNPDPNLITGAIAGGPAQDGSYADDRSRYEQSEPIMYINAGFMGAVSRVARGSAGVSGSCTAAGGGGSNPPPTTQSPATPSPTTQSPTTSAPTQSPTTPSPTESPTTSSPTTQSPTTQSPTTPSPTQSESTPSPTESSTTSAPTQTPSPTQSDSTPSPTQSPSSTDSPTQSPTTPAPTQGSSTDSPTPSPTTPAPTTPAPTQSSPTTTSPTSAPTDSPTGSPSKTSSPAQDNSNPPPSTSSPTPSPSNPTPSTSSPTPSTSSPTPSTTSSPPSTSNPPSSGSGGNFVVTSTEDSSWNSDGGKVTLYTVTIKNVSGRTFDNVAVKCDNFHPDQYWNLLKGGADGECAVPTWMSTFAPGAMLTFGYIQGGSGAQFSVNL